MGIEAQEKMMMRIVCVVGRDGTVDEVPMMAEQAAFFLRMAELKAQTDPEITFNTVVAQWKEELVAWHQLKERRAERL